MEKENATLKAELSKNSKLLESSKTQAESTEQRLQRLERLLEDKARKD